MGSHDTRRSGGDSPPQEVDRPRYTSLKRWMKKEFRTIRDVLSQGRMPDPGLAGSFVDDCLRMCAYPGKGEEYYPAFAAAARKFGAAAKAADLAAALEAVAELRAIKRNCHDRYKPPKA